MTRVSKRRGMAAATAVTMLALVAVTIAAMGSLFAAEARRTRDAAAEAQLRQLLIAGESIAGEQMPASTIEVKLPSSLEGASLTLQPGEAPDVDTKLYTIDARWGDRQMTQSLRYVRRDGGWQLASAELNP